MKILLGAAVFVVVLNAGMAAALADDAVQLPCKTVEDCKPIDPCKIAPERCKENPPAPTPSPPPIPPKDAVGPAPSQ